MPQGALRGLQGIHQSVPLCLLARPPGMSWGAQEPWGWRRGHRVEHCHAEEGLVAALGGTDRLSDVGGVVEGVADGVGG